MSISLSASLRSGVNALQDIESVFAITNNRLQTGKKVNSALDNANSYFQAAGFRKESRDLSGLLEKLILGKNTIDKAAKALDASSKLVESVQALARTALASTDSATRNRLGADIAGLLTQGTRLIRDSAFDGKGVLVTDSTTGVVVAGTLTAPVKTAGTLTLQTSTDATNFTSIVVNPADVRFGSTVADGGLGLGVAANGFTLTGVGTSAASFAATAATTFDVGVAGDANLNALLTASTTALSGLQARAAVVATQASVVDIRVQFNKDSSRILNSSADSLTLADINEEGANLTTLQTRQQLAVQALSLASRSDQAILRLF